MMLAAVSSNENPFLAPAARDEDDARLAARAADGDRAALELLIVRHQRWVYAIALRMVRNPDAARDLAQEAMLRVVTRMAQFEGRSSFRTWAYRIVVRCMLDVKKAADERLFSGFERFGMELDALPLGPLELSASLEPERAYIVEETRIGCLLGMLLCLDRDQRIAYVLGAILGAPSEVAADVLGISPPAFRKRLERARIDLSEFMNDKCGLVNEENPCRCPRKTAALVRAGSVDPSRLRFAPREVRAARRELPTLSRRLDVIGDDRSLAEFDSLPIHEGPNLALAIVGILSDPATRDALRLDRS